MPCVLRIWGQDLDAASLARATSLIAYRINQKGEAKSRTRVFNVSAIHVDVSDAGFENLSAQVEDAIRFVTQNEAAIQQAVAFDHVQGACLDFGVDIADVAIDTKTLPPELLRRCGALGVGIDISLYPSGEEPIQPTRGS